MTTRMSPRTARNGRNDNRIVLSSAGGVSLRHRFAGTTPHIDPPSSRRCPSESAVIVHSPARIVRDFQATGAFEAGEIGTISSCKLQ
jgi:hypothetical protein